MNEGNCLEKWLVYIHHIPGLLTFKNLIEASEETEDKFDIIGADYGKGIMKIMYNSSTKKLNKQYN